MTRVRLVGAGVAVAAIVALGALAWAGEPRAEAGTAVEMAPLSVAVPRGTPTATGSDDADATPGARPSGRPTPVAPPAAPPVPLDGRRAEGTPRPEN